MVIKHFKKKRAFRSLPIIIIDIPRAEGLVTKSKLYAAIEGLQSAEISSGKYMGSSARWRTPPFIVVLSNELPCAKKLTADRIRPFLIRNDPPAFPLDVDRVTLTKLEKAKEVQDATAALMEAANDSTPAVCIFSDSKHPNTPVSAMYTYAYGSFGHVRVETPPTPLHSIPFIVSVMFELKHPQRPI